MSVDDSIGEPFERADIREAGLVEQAVEIALRQRPGDALPLELIVVADRRIRLRFTHHIGDHQAASWTQHSRDLRESRPLIGRQVDHTVRERDVHALALERQGLQVSLLEAEVVEAQSSADMLGTFPRQGEHGIEHVDADHPTSRADSTRCHEALDSAPAAEVEHVLTDAQLCIEDRAAAAIAPNAVGRGDVAHLLIWVADGVSNILARVHCRVCVVEFDRRAGVIRGQGKEAVRMNQRDAILGTAALEDVAHLRSQPRRTIVGPSPRLPRRQPRGCHLVQREIGVASARLTSGEQAVVRISSTQDVSPR